MIASNRYQILPPLISREPNTTKHIEREVSAGLITQQSLISGKLIFTGTYKPLDSVPQRPSGVLEVLAVPISGTESPTLKVGPFELEAGRDYVPGAVVADTATAIAAAISNLPGYSAVPLLAVVFVEGPAGATELAFDSIYASTVQTFSFTYTEVEGFLGYDVRPLFPIEVT